MQRYLFDLLQRGPLTFAEIRHIAAGDGVILYPTVERSLRRAMRGLIDGNSVIATGHGGPSDPLRYHINPLMLAFIAGDPKILDKHDPEAVEKACKQWATQQDATPG